MSIDHGCYEHVAFVLDYGGPFQCSGVQYLTGGAIGVVLLLIVVVLAVCKWRKKSKSSGSSTESADAEQLPPPSEPGVSQVHSPEAILK